MRLIISYFFTYLFSIWRKAPPIISLNLVALAVVLGISPLLFLATLPQQKVIQCLIFLAFFLLFFFS